MRRLFAALLGAAALAAGSALYSAPVSADVGIMEYELDYAKSASGEPPLDAPCDGPALRACFAKYGDVWWVRDITNDGWYNQEIQWENRLFDGTAWFLYREGACISQLGYNRWGTCNKDYYESSSLNAWDSYGSQVRFRECNGASSCGSWTNWINNNG